MVDAALVVDLICGFPAAEAFRGALASADAVAAPAHLDAEVLSALSRLRRAGQLTLASERVEALATFGATRWPLRPLVPPAWGTGRPGRDARRALRRPRGLAGRRLDHHRWTPSPGGRRDRQSRRARRVSPRRPRSPRLGRRNRSGQAPTVPPYLARVPAHLLTVRDAATLAALTEAVRDAVVSALGVEVTASGSSCRRCRRSRRSSSGRSCRRRGRSRPGSTRTRSGARAPARAAHGRGRRSS